MIKELITYPDERIKYISADVRKFDDELFELLENMHDTMAHRGLEAISAIQIAVPFSAIIVKDEERLIELINARIILNEGKDEGEENSAYFPAGFSATIKRYGKIKVVYENRHGELEHLDVDGALSRRIQQQVDFLFGGTLLDKMGKDNRLVAEKQLAQEGFITGESCPVVFVRDYFKRGAKYLMALVGFTFVLPFFISPELRALVYTFDKYALTGVVLLMIVYFIYAQYEGKQYKQCTSCQIGNIIGTTVIMAFQLFIAALGVFFWIVPK
jgi:peptide deformylase